jgi:uncharacterized protein (TIGR00369 family)
MAEREPGIDGISRFIGLRWEAADRTRVTITPELLNAAGLLQGATTYTMIDYTMGSALWRETTEEEAIATLNLSVNYVQTATEGDIVCTAEVDRRTRTNAVLRSEVRHDDGRLIATAVGAFVIYQAKKFPTPEG